VKHVDRQHGRKTPEQPQNGPDPTATNIPTVNRSSRDVVHLRADPPRPASKANTTTSAPAAKAAADCGDRWVSRRGFGRDLQGGEEIEVRAVSAEPHARNLQTPYLAAARRAAGSFSFSKRREATMIRNADGRAYAKRALNECELLHLHYQPQKAANH
jgi:hypothetical protein